MNIEAPDMAGTHFMRRRTSEPRRSTFPTVRTQRAVCKSKLVALSIAVIATPTLCIVGCTMLQLHKEWNVEHVVLVQAPLVH